MKLSDAFLGDDDGEIALQLTVRVYNINSDNKCIDSGILPDFLRKYGTEMVEMLFRELTREEDMEISRLDGYDDGLEEGLRRGEAAGFEKGRAEGEAVGLEKGRANAILELAKAMKSNGRPITNIAADTGLTVEEIERL